MWFGDKTLKGKKIAILAADGFERVELVVPAKVLKANGAKVDVISLRPGRIRGVNLHEPASRTRVNKVVTEADPTEYDGLFIPGGLINPDLLRQSAEAREFVQAFATQEKPIASICHGPWVLASAGLLQGRVVTSWPGIRDDLVNAGATWLNQEVIQDGNLVTSRGPQDLEAFSRAIVDLFAGKSTFEPVVKRDLDSDPQAKAPPEVMLKAMAWIPRPSLRTALGLGLFTLGYLASRRNQRKPAVPWHQKVSHRMQRNAESPI